MPLTTMQTAEHQAERARRISSLATLLLAYHDDAGVTTSLRGDDTLAIARYIDGRVERDALCDPEFCDGSSTQLSGSERDDILGEYDDAADNLVAAFVWFLNIVFES